MERIDMSIWLACIEGLAAVVMMLLAAINGDLLWTIVFMADSLAGAYVVNHYLNRKKIERAEAPE